MKRIVLLSSFALILAFAAVISPGSAQNQPGPGAAQGTAMDAAMSLSTCRVECAAPGATHAAVQCRPMTYEACRALAASPGQSCRADFVPSSWCAAGQKRVR